MSPKLDIFFRACSRNSYQMALRLTDPPSKQSYNMSVSGFRLWTRNTGGQGPQRPVCDMEKVGG